MIIISSSVPRIKRMEPNAVEALLWDFAFIAQHNLIKIFCKSTILCNIERRTLYLQNFVALPQF